MWIVGAKGYIADSAPLGWCIRRVNGIVLCTACDADGEIEIALWD